MRVKVSVAEMEQLKGSFGSLQSVQLAGEENLSQKLNLLKEDFESKTRELLG